METPPNLHEYLLYASSYNDRLAEKVRNALVHQRMRLDKIQREIRQRPAIVVTLSRSRIRHLRTLHRQPIRVDGRLLFEVALECVGDVLQAEGANGAAGNAIRRRRERGVDELRHDVTVFSVYQFRCGFYERDSKKNVLGK